MQRNKITDYIRDLYKLWAVQADAALKVPFLTLADAIEQFEADKPTQYQIACITDAYNEIKNEREWYQKYSYITE